MTQRTEARFKVLNRSNTTIFGTFIYNTIDFNVGGTYDTSTYEYTVDNSGTYLIGYSYSKKNQGSNNNFDAQSKVQLTRGGTTYTISHSRLTGAVANTTISNCFMYKFEVGDKLQIVAVRGQPKMNQGNYSGNDILNSWWGIKLNY